MRIIFLDIDGVLNTERYVVEQFNKIGKIYKDFTHNFDPICMRYLKALVEEFNAKIVITSSWRLSHKSFITWNTTGVHDCTCGDWEAIIRNLKDFGIDKTVIGVTRKLNVYYTPKDCLNLFGDVYMPRGYEIKTWLYENKHLNIKSFVILDDDSDMQELSKTHLAKCDYKTGITEYVYNQAKNILEVCNTIDLTG